MRSFAGRGVMHVTGIVGWSGSGKTTLIAALLVELRAAGHTVSTVKHAHSGFDIDQPGKDSYRHRTAGALEVLIASAGRWALLHENFGEEPPLSELLGRLTPVDLVLVEGFKSHPHPKLEVYRPALGKPPLWPGMSDVIAVASDEPLAGCDRLVLPLNDAAQIARWLLSTPTIGR